MKNWLIGSLTVGFFLASMVVVTHSSADGQGGSKVGNVTEARVIAEASNGDNWPVNGGNFGEQHFSPLKQITDKNVNGLGLAWSLDVDSPMGMATEPIVVDGVIYATASLDRVLAVDAASGKVLWKFDPHVRLSVMRNSWASRTNRGVAVWEGKVYVGTGDCRLIALDAATGGKLWDSPVCVDTTQTGITGAPHFGKGNVFIGYNGSDTGVRGSVVAFDANTGKIAWRFWNMPDDPSKGFENPAMEMAAKTWSGDDWWKLGGADVWDPITYDPVTGYVIYGTAGAGAGALHGDRSGMKVSGDRLFAGCIVAVDAATGKYVWHYQTSVRTENMHVLAADLVISGQKQHVVMTVPKSGIFYVLDAKTGKLISQNPIDGRPRPADDAAGGGGRGGVAIQPTGEMTAAAGGRGRGQGFAGHNWWPMSYSPLTGLVYVPTHDVAGTEETGQPHSIGKLYAWDPIKQSARWSVEEQLPTNSGLLSTAGNLVFQGEGTGEFAAYAADTGRKLWSIKTGSAIDAVPVSFSLKGEQYILVPVGLGSASRMFGRVSAMATPESKRGPSRLLAFKLGARVPFPYPNIVVPQVPKPPVQDVSAETIQKGAAVFGRFMCEDCHSPQADGSGAWVVDGAIPDLRYMPADVHDQFLGIVLAGTHVSNGMPAFGSGAGFPLIETKMTVDEANALHAYIIDLSWKAYNEQQHAEPNATKP
jgi:quinohemoprotein ethanol dehydrogenase